MESKYIYNLTQYSKYQEFISDLPRYEKCVEVKEIVNGIILPSVYGGSLYWGKGGVITNTGELIDSSTVPGAFGGVYDISNKDIEYRNETVLFCGIMPLHWGHFIIDYLSRLWVIPTVNDNIRIAYFNRYFDGNVGGNYEKCLKLLGIQPDRLLKIDRPTQFCKVLVPEAAMAYAYSFDSLRYKSVINLIKKNALSEAHQRELKEKKKIYFSRTHFSNRDVGEWEIEKGFKENGFEILYPEQLSVVEQIFYISNAEILVSLSGTIPHNFIFANKEAKIIILNRFPITHYPQYQLNYVFNLDVEWIDVYNKWYLLHQTNYGSPKIWVEFSPCLRRYFEDNSLAIPKVSIWVPLRNWLLFKYYWTCLPIYRSFRHSVGKLFKRIF